MSDINLLIDYPLLCTKYAALYPNNDLVIEAGRDFSKKAIEKSFASFDSYIIVAPQIENTDKINLKTVSLVATIGQISNVRAIDANITKVNLKGISRVKITNIHFEEDCYYASIVMLEEDTENQVREEACMKKLDELIDSLSLSEPRRKNVLSIIKDCETAASKCDALAKFFITDPKYGIDILNELDIVRRTSIVLSFFESKKEVDKIEEEISNKVRQRLDDNQREYILREKLRAIKEELGETLPNNASVDDLVNEFKNNPYPESVKQKALNELQRLEEMPSASPEYSMLKTYIEWLKAIPWFKKSTDNEDIKKVEDILNEDHYGLEKIKERIIEYLAVKTVTNSLKAPIICFAGPPGVGKTSLAKSIARALDRKFVKMSLGGLKDESEIRGHRRTYLGALPGRIIQCMKKAGVTNPVFLLDEIDKMGADYKGDPTSAMLELLDPEQNKYFSDNYIEEPYDLSNVLFICTANYLEDIPAPLYDRLEIINVSSYTEIEKVNIATKHLVPKQLINHGIENEGILFNEDALLYIIQYYTREAGVRNLERHIATICRKLVVRKLRNENKEIDIKTITINEVKEFLGKEAFDFSKKEQDDQVGVVTGLAYTQTGGDILPVEVNYFEGNGQLILTGKLGEVIKESAMIAFDYVKANAKMYNIDTEMLNKINVHIHMPEGAIPKDGPSAGITITTAIVSMLTNRSVKHTIAMTGEVTLRGNVLAIGGLKEKSISALRSGIKTVIIPKDNLKDLDELPKVVLDNIKFIPVSKVDEVINLALN